MTDEDDILAAEFALGLLDDAEAASVQSRARTDSVLSLRIAWWRDQLAPLASEVETPAPAGVWQRIEGQLPGNDNSQSLMQRWRAAAVASMSMAAALLAFIAFRPDPAPVSMPSEPTPMIAALSGEKGAVVAVTYEPTSGKMIISPTVLDPGKGDAEMWIIPEGGKPVSMGIMNAKLTETHNVPMPMRPMVQPGATFAITQEVKGGSPDGNPHGPIVASGKIIST
jgi:anti-sigma-K factor RskA